MIQLLEAINSSSGVNFATLNRFPSIVRGGVRVSDRGKQSTEG